MNPRIATLILGAMTAIGSASPVNLAAEARSVLNPRDNDASNSTAPGEFHSLVNTPTPQADTPTPQAITHVYVCTDAYFHGRCVNLESITHHDAGCKGESRGGIVNPGILNLGDYDFNDRTSSYRCY
ncbi:MAG: hypothetical protein Q9171_005692 [Xanthocarpia ochracea]